MSRVAALQIPLHMLPAVRVPGQVIGYSSNSSISISANSSPTALANRFGLPNGTAVYIPMGEHPCTVMAAIAQGNQSDNGANSSLTCTFPRRSDSMSPCHALRFGVGMIQWSTSAHQHSSRSCCQLKKSHSLTRIRCTRASRSGRSSPTIGTSVLRLL